MSLTKLDQLREYSDPDYVMWKAQELGYNPIHESSRKDKKYMVFDGHKMIHFGQFGATDYTKHLDDKRRMNFRKRNWRWEYTQQYSASNLSFTLLW
jgi:Family of unknown function (DUF5754)